LKSVSTRRWSAGVILERKFELFAMKVIRGDSYATKALFGLGARVDLYCTISFYVNPTKKNGNKTHFHVQFA
jgi:hypothetical protein